MFIKIRESIFSVDMASQILLTKRAGVLCNSACPDFNSVIRITLPNNYVPQWLQETYTSCFRTELRKCVVEWIFKITHEFTKQQTRLSNSMGNDNISINKAYHLKNIFNTSTDHCHRSYVNKAMALNTELFLLVWIASYPSTQRLSSVCKRHCTHECSIYKAKVSSIKP